MVNAAIRRRVPVRGRVPVPVVRHFELVQRARPPVGLPRLLVLLARRFIVGAAPSRLHLVIHRLTICSALALPLFIQRIEIE